jgi:hypothetical protein
VSEIFADRICKLCSDDLRVFASLREDLIIKQRNLYELAGLDDSHYIIKVAQDYQVDYEEATVVPDDENSQDFDVGFESVDDGHMFEEEPMDEEEFISEETAEEDETATAVIKIEKVEGADEPLEHDFDYFEEIIAEEETGTEEGLVMETTAEMYVLPEIARISFVIPGPAQNS